MTGSKTRPSFLTEDEKMEVRRFCGYPAVGHRLAGQESWRFFQVEGALEWRLNHLSAAEMRRLRIHLSQLSLLEEALIGVSDTLDTAQVAVWSRNAHELQDRRLLFLLWRRRLCSFLGVTGGLELHEGSMVVV